MKRSVPVLLLGVCAVLLVAQVSSEQQEGVNEIEDPFLASVEAHVVAVAQKRLREKASKEASQNHISEARAAIKASLNAAHENNYNRHKAPAAQLTETDSQADSSDKHKKKKKTFTWAQLQAGEDIVEDKPTVKKDTKAMGSLMNKLKAAPTAEKVPADETKMISDVLHPSFNDVPSKEQTQEPADDVVPEETFEKDKDEDEDEEEDEDEDAEDDEDVEETDAVQTDADSDDAQKPSTSDDVVQEEDKDEDEDEDEEDEEEGEYYEDEDQEEDDEDEDEDQDDENEEGEEDEEVQTDADDDDEYEEEDVQSEYEDEDDEDDY